jgi:TP901 family phage tail tape measure protein
MASEIRAGKAYVELFLKGDIKKSLDQVSKQLKAFGDQIGDIGKKLAGIGTAVTAPLLVAAQRFASMGDEMEKASQRTGIAVESLSALKYAAEQSGSSFEDLETGVKKMNKAIFEAEGGSVEAQKSLAGIGLTVKDLKGLSPDEQFQKIGLALNNVGDAGAKSAIAMEIFGKGGTELLPFFARGSDGIQALTKHAKELGIVMSGDDAKAATAFSEVLNDVWQQINALTFAVGAAVAQALQPFAEAATQILSKVIGWAKEHRTLIIAVLATGVALLTAGAALIGLGGAITLAGVAIEGIVAVFGLLSSAVLLLLNPIALIGAGLIGLAVYFGVATKFGADCLAWLGAKFNELKDTASEAFGGIADALGAGDILLAAKILWTGLQVAWAEGSQELMGYWYKFRTAFTKVAADAFYGSLELWEEVKSGLQSSWNDVSSYFAESWHSTIGFLGSLWDGFVNVFVSTWQWAVNEVTHALNYIHSLWDKSFDSNAANKAADDFISDQQRQRDQADITSEQKREADLKATNAAIENAKKVKAAQIAADKSKTLSGLVDANAATDKGADKNGADDIAALQARKLALEADLKGLRGKAASEKTAKKDAGPTPLDPSKSKGLQDVLASRNDVAQPAKAQGIFGAQGLQSLQSGPALSQKQIAKNTLDAVKYLREIASAKAKMK